MIALTKLTCDGIVENSVWSKALVFPFARVSVSINFQEENRCRPSRITRPTSLRRPYEWNSSFLVKKRDWGRSGRTTEEPGGKEQDEKRSLDGPFEASRGFHGDIEGTKDRRRIRHVQSMHSKYLMGREGGESGCMWRGRESFEDWVLYLEGGISPFSGAHLKQKYALSGRDELSGRQACLVNRFQLLEV